jgi:rfaE bifunctional protein nucleotidyltransferase chain/domain
LANRWGVHAVAATLGERGAMLVQRNGPPLVVPVSPVRANDTCGAGDRFASAVAVALTTGAVLSEAVEVATATATAFVAAGAASAYMVAEPSARLMFDRQRAPLRGAEVSARVRARGGVVVATGGCFDILHAGHVAALQAARQLGDCLVVFLNSDASVRRLKGDGRPLQSVGDRVAVLQALDCVDAVDVFDGDTPVRALEQVQPDVFAKGGDYALDDLAEARAVARWGGEAVVLPYLTGRSTTEIVQRAQRKLAGRAWRREPE